MKFVVAFLAICAAAQAYLPQLEDDIFAGFEVDISEFPYQVSVRKHDKHICGGSIINSKTILTAAQCISGEDHSNYSVRVGSNAHADGNHYMVQYIIKNNNYTHKTLEYDIAILKVINHIIFTDNVQPIELQPLGIEVPVDSIASVSGWGVTAENNATIPALLREVKVAVISSEKCSDMYNRSIVITSHMLCVKSIAQGNCYGDLGGPLAFEGKLIGVVSGGYRCTKPDYPVVYAKVSSMFDWIVENSN